MWARRCGAPPLWPSRVKVLLQSFFTAAIGLAVYNYMSNADIGYLDLRQPQGRTAFCLEPGRWPLRHSWSSWFDADSYDEYFKYRFDTPVFISDNRCHSKAQHQAAECMNVDVLIDDLDRLLGVPLAPLGGQWRNDTVEAYGYLFLFFSIVTWICVTIHDLALLSGGDYKQGVYDFRAIRNRFPCATVLYRFWGLRFWKRMLANRGMIFFGRRFLDGRGRILGIVLAPLFILWFVLAYMLIVMPVAAVFFVVYPVRLSRIFLFLNCFAIGVFGVMLTVHSIIWIGWVEQRQLYAVTWTSPTADGSFCECGCVYAVKGSVSINLMLVGLGVAYRAFTLAFRCLKGLRRANWANFMSILYPIPLTVYDVFWTQPDGKPIQHRVEDQSVQAELAFDPFALMDEQPNSAQTTVHLVPTAIMPNADPCVWDVEDVVGYLEALRLHQYGPAVREHGVDGLVFLQLIRCDGLQELGIESDEHAARVRARLGLWSPTSGFRLELPGSSPAFVNNRRSMNSPRSTHLKEAPEYLLHREYIGCCGFPCIKGEYSSLKKSDSDEEDPEHAPVRSTVSSRQVGPRRTSRTGTFSERGLWIPTERVAMGRQAPAAPVEAPATAAKDVDTNEVSDAANN